MLEITRGACILYDIYLHVRHQRVIYMYATKEFIYMYATKEFVLETTTGRIACILYYIIRVKI